VTVKVGNLWTNVLEFDDYSPVLYTDDSDYLPDPDGYRTDALPDGGGNVTAFSFLFLLFFY
jgi:hypothetical protein